MTDSAPPSQRKSSRWIYLIGIAIFLVYAALMLGPYFRSIIVRDAAVTSWSYMATSPIAGRIEAMPASVGDKTGSDGVIAVVRNDLLSRQALTETSIKVEYAQAKVQELQVLIDEIKLLDSGRADLKSRYADAFRSQLDVQIANLNREIKVTGKQLDLMRKIAARKEKLASGGSVPRNAVDEAMLRVAELELQLTQLKSHLAHAIVRREPADHSVFISADGDDPDWVRGSRLDLKLRKKQTRLELRKAQAELELAIAAFAALEEEFERLSEAAVTAPAGSTLWSERAALGATVNAGSPVAEWLLCSTLMIDVPVSDAEVSLIKPGMEAEVILEGETVVRKAAVHLTRGSASPLGREDLAAIAKGRGAGIAQVLLEFSHAAADFSDCPVGRAAYIDFPDIGLIDVLRARLRL